MVRFGTNPRGGGPCVPTTLRRTHVPDRRAGGVGTTLVKTCSTATVAEASAVEGTHGARLQYPEWELSSASGRHKWACSTAAGGGDDDLLAPPQLPSPAEHVGAQVHPHFFGLGIEVLDGFHTLTGLPWWVSITLSSLGIKTALLPVSLRNAKVIRNNLALWSQSAELAEQAVAKHKMLSAESKPAYSAGKARGHQLGPEHCVPDISVPVAMQLEPERDAKALACAVLLHNPDQGSEGSSISSRSTSGALASSTSGGTIYDEVTDRQPAANSSSATTNSSAVLWQDVSLRQRLEQLGQLHRRGMLYHELRRKCGVPHPAWVLINMLLQGPIFIYTALCIRRMAAPPPWPGFTDGGTLWFSDLSLPALNWVPASLVGFPGADVAASAATTLPSPFPSLACVLPMGYAGLVLPLLVTGMTLATVRIGLAAIGPNAARMPGIAGTWLAGVLHLLPGFLYAGVALGAVAKLHQPHAALLHWNAMAGFTLGLQLALRRPLVRAWLLGMPTASVGHTPGAIGSSDDMPPGLVAAVAGVDNAAVLVVMGAQQAARQRYAAALYCLDSALRLDPNNMRAHYSRGQVLALTKKWKEAVASFERSTELAEQVGDPDVLGQTLYCLGSAMQAQGRTAEAISMLERAKGLWLRQPVVLIALVQAYQDHGNLVAARAALASAWVLESELSTEGNEQRGLKEVLGRLKLQLAGERQAASEKGQQQ